MKKILYIEDDPVSLTIVSKIVEKMGYEFIAAYNSDEGLAKAGAYLPDLILMDVFLPGVDGLETTMHIRSAEHLKDIPVIALTASQSAGDDELARVAGCDAILRKPIDAQEFMRLVNVHIDRPRLVSLDIEEEALGLKKFSHRLVQRLTDKIHELAHTNSELEAANRTLDKLVSEVRVNNNDLLRFNDLANKILTISTREKLYQTIPTFIVETVGLASAALYVVNEQDLTLDIFSHQDVDAPTADHISFTKGPFFDTVYYQEPVLIDAAWLQAAQRVDEQVVQRVRPLREAFRADVLYFLPIIGRPKGDAEFHCQNQDCQAFVNKDSNWWSKQIQALDPGQLYYDSQIKQLSEFYFNCCLFRLKGILVLGLAENRAQEMFRQMIQSFVRNVGLMLDNIQLYDDMKDLYLESEQRAIVDSQSGLYNYRFFHGQLEREIKRSKRHWSKLSVVIIELKLTEQGQQNDAILQGISAVLLLNTRTSDIAARYSRETFAMILPETPHGAASKLVDKIIGQLAADKNLEGIGRDQVKIGLSTFPDDAQTADELTMKAFDKLS